MAIRWWTEEVKFTDGAIYTPYFDNNVSAATLWNNTNVTLASRYTGIAVNSYFNLAYLFRTRGENVINREYQHYFFGGSGLYIKNVPNENSNNQKAVWGVQGYSTTSYVYIKWNGLEYNNILGFIIDDVNKEAKLIAYTEGTSSGRIVQSVKTVYGEAPANFRKNLYNALTGAIPVYSHYKSVPGLFSINGNKTLSVLTDDVTDNPITTFIDTDKIVVNPESCMFGYDLSSMSVGDSRLIAWSGDNKCFLGKESGQYDTTYTFRLSFAFGGQPTSLTVSREYLANHYRVWLGFVIDENLRYAQPCILENDTGGPAGYRMVVFNITDEAQLSAYYRWLTPSLNRDDRPVIPNPFVDNPQNQPAGGVDFHPRYDNPNTPQAMRITSGINNGFAQVFAMSETNVRELANVLWSDDFIDTIKKLFGNPADIVLGLNIFPVVPARDENLTEIKAGNVSTGIQAHKINNRYQTFDCGSIDIKGVWDCYLDFAPNTKIELYLPFCGNHSLDTDDLMQTFTPDNTIKAGSTLSLRYVVDFLTGACVAQLMVNGSVHYQFPGSCSSSVPINSQSYLNGLTTLINTVATSLVTIATKGLSAPATAGVIGTSLASNVVNSKPEITKSGNLTGELGFLSYNAPYLTITEPIQASVDAQRQFTGLPNYYVRPLNECTGYTKVADVHIEGFSCTDEEREEIENLLKDGVLI